MTGVGEMEKKIELERLLKQAGRYKIENKRNDYFIYDTL